MSRRPPPQQGLSTAAGRGIVVIVIGVVIGLVILLSSSFSSGASDTVTTGTTTTAATTTTAPQETTTTTLPAPDKSTFKVLVANGSGISGAAGRLTTKLQGLGYQMEPAATATSTVDATTVYYISGAEAAAQSVARDIGSNITVAAMPTQPPVNGLGQASVLVVEGKDVASDAPGTTSTSAAAAGATTTTVKG